MHICAKQFNWKIELVFHSTIRYSIGTPVYETKTEYAHVYDETITFNIVIFH